MRRKPGLRQKGKNMMKQDNNHNKTARKIVRTPRNIGLEANDNMSIFQRRLIYAITFLALENRSKEVSFSLNQLIQLLKLTGSESNYRRLKEELDTVLEDCYFRFEAKDEESDVTEDPWEYMYVFSGLKETQKNNYTVKLNDLYYDSVIWFGFGCFGGVVNKIV